jgi:trehalose synthase-fused probable maltokinase
MSFTLFEGLSEASLKEILPDLASSSLPGFLPDQRWFGDKSSTIDTVSVDYADVERLDAEWLVLQIVRVTFSEGGEASYFVPLVITPEEPPALGTIRTLEGEYAIVDALQTASFRRWLIDGLFEDRVTKDGKISWSSTGALRSLGEIDRDASRISTAQQSNSSVVFDETIMVKVFRKLNLGVNPEIELGRFLTTKSSFRNAPAMLGSWSMTGAEGVPISLGVVHRFAGGSVDAWTYVRQQLRDRKIDDVSAAAELGAVIARLHLALESARDDEDLTPERIDQGDVDRWSSSLRATLDEAIVLMSAKASESAHRELIETFLDLAPNLAAQTTGFERLIGKAKIRVHGDLHLGQILVTPEREFLVLDFEGEPRRPIPERRQKTTPLKDVAGMLRSFSYARGGAEREEPADEIPSTAELVQWERATRRAFLESYLAETRKGQARFLPASNDDFRQAIAAWELDKALYEILYELNNRPDWLPIPLAGTLKLG